ncbi:hypothetical protein H0H81_012150 [Sphagnurus paluster]|uniref:RRM domain-containing protein n=1 Tax=Sphagnurus paluster TaxID=117069 RepID=A0A9P7FUS7_9AGAR|nr:hypothetical protein H0H81_012150 [Sphagnurus paluster]
MATAEKAFAILCHQKIPQVTPVATLELSTTPNGSPPSTETLGHPRNVKFLPASSTDKDLYELMRPFGPLISARVDKKLGGFIRFWMSETDANAAETAVKTALARSSKVTLQAFDPLKLFCRNISPEVDAKMLKNHFKEFPSVTSARVVSKGGYGFISFSKAEEALDAIGRHDGSRLGGKALIVRYRDFSQSEAAKTPPAPTAKPAATTTSDKTDSATPKPSNSTPCDATPKSNSSHDKDQSDAAQTYLVEVLLADIVTLKAQIAQDKDKHQSQMVSMTARLTDSERAREDSERLREEAEMLREQAEMLREESEGLREESERLREKSEMLREETEKRARLAEQALQDRALRSDVETEGWMSRFGGLQLKYDELKVQHELEIAALSAKSAAGLQEKENMEGLLTRITAERDEWQRKFTIADSRRKILELEADRPQWEEAKKQREKKLQEEAAEAERVRKQADMEESERKIRELIEEEKRRKQEQKLRKEQEKLRQEKEEAARQAREAEAEVQRKRALAKEHARQLAWTNATTVEHQRCSKRDSYYEKTWNNHTALSRFLVVIEEFEKAKFSDSQPLTVGSIPWPMLDKSVLSSNTMDVEVTWVSVEMFFTFVKSRRDYGKTEYNKLVERVHRMFHPDKWRSRRLLDSVQDPTTRKFIEESGNKVAQAVTPIWTQTK